MSCTRIITLAFISLELFPFDYFPYKISCLLYNLKTVRDISMKLSTLIMTGYDYNLLTRRKGVDISFHIENILVYVAVKI